MPSVFRALGLAAFVLGLSPPAFADNNLPPYVPLPDKLGGELRSVGSETLAFATAFWGTDFKRLYPGVKFQMDHSGSSSAPPALLDGSASLGMMSRPMKEAERGAFQAKYGYPPTEFRVGLDAIAVLVHKDNPLKGLSVTQVDAIFSSTRRCGHATEISNWSQVEAGADLVGREISLFGRNSMSGTYGYFQEKALCGGKYKKEMKGLPGPVDVMRSIAALRNAIGYGGIGHLSGDVRTVPIAAETGAAYVPASRERIADGSYPLTRFLYLYVNKAPGKPLPALEREFIKMVLSSTGQARLDQEGFLPLSPEAISQERQKL